MKFDFKLPGKGKDGPETKAADAKPDDGKDDAEPTYTRAELGKGLATAIKSGDGEAIYEAWKKMSDSTPSD